MSFRKLSLLFMTLLLPLTGCAGKTASAQTRAQEVKQFLAPTDVNKLPASIQAKIGAITGRSKQGNR